MADQMKKRFVSDELFPPVPASYYERMEDVLASLPEQHKTVGSLSRKQILILAAALLVLLAAGTALAVGISRMKEVKDSSQNVVSAYQAIVQNESSDLPVSGGPEEAVPTPYVTLKKYETNENGEWQPQEIEDINVLQTVDDLTLRLDRLDFNGMNNHLMVTFWIEAEKARPYLLQDLRLSVNGGEPMDSISEAYRPQSPEPGATPMPSPTPLVADEWFNDKMDEVNPVFEFPSNPLRPGTVFSITGTLNGTPFSLTYDLSEEAFERLRARELGTLQAISETLSAVPEETIPVNASMRGMAVEEVAVKDHYLYVVYHYDREYRSDPNNITGPAYDEYDKGIRVAVDGMLSDVDFISSSTDENGDMHMIERAYFPYGETVPKESLIGFLWTVFRVNWEKGEAYGPGDETEYLDWRKESAELSAADYGTDYAAKPDQSCKVFRLTEMIYLNKNAGGQLAVILETDEPVKNALKGRENQPVVTVAGITLDNEVSYVQDPDSFDGGTDDGGRRNSFWLYCPAYRTLPETFEVTVSWRGGTVSFTMQKTDFKAEILDFDTYDRILNF